jgi:hypothetical protein
MANSRVIQQAAKFFIENGIKYKTIKMFGKMLVVNVYDYETARTVQDVLNGAQVQKTGIEGPTEDEDYDVAGLVEEALAQHFKEINDEDWNEDAPEE